MRRAAKRLRLERRGAIDPFGSAFVDNVHQSVPEIGETCQKVSYPRYTGQAYSEFAEKKRDRDMLQRSERTTGSRVRNIHFARPRAATARNFSPSNGVSRSFERSR